jgi:hypothetical protein
MPIPSLKPADWGDSVDSLQTIAGHQLYKRVDLNWTRPTEWRKEMKVPDFDTKEPFLYALIGNQNRSDDFGHIVYVGLTKAPKTRFAKHWKAREILEKDDSVLFSYAELNHIRGRDRLRRVGLAMEEIEHLLIWALPPEHLKNVAKQASIPGQGKNHGNAWHVINGGYRFSGRMPREIVFPWMIVKSGRASTK